jgi:hypothetical protein
MNTQLEKRESQGESPLAQYGTVSQVVRFTLLLWSH